MLPSEMVSLTSSFNHNMLPRSLLDFFFPLISPHAFRTPSLSFLQSGASVLTSSFSLFSSLTLVWFSFNFQIFLFMMFFLTIFFRTFLSRVYNHQPVLKFPWNHFYISYILSAFFSHKCKINFISHPPALQVIFLLSAL